MANILLVDDDDDVTVVLSEVLATMNHRVRIAKNGREGLLCLEQKYPDLVLLDVEMPELNGPDMAYHMFLHDLGQEFIPLLLISGNQDLHLIARQVGTPYFLSKPFSLEALDHAIKLALSERKPPFYIGRSQAV